MTQSDNITLVTGGTGYIGSHTVLELVKKGLKVVVVDNLSNSCVEPLNRICKLANLPKGSIPFEKVDLLDLDALNRVFDKYPSIDRVIHFAALKAVGESVEQPLRYYENNIGGTLNLLKAMIKHNVKNIVFSSSATVYKAGPDSKPFKEDATLGCTNPYGRTKLFMESIIKDVVDSNEGWNAIILRYFNPTGAEPSGLMGEDPQGIPNNLMPYVSQVAVGVRPFVRVFGNDYKTRDGTGVRDYIHVCDLAEAHVMALDKLDSNCGYKIYNLGSGTGYSVLEMIKAMGDACGKKLPYEIQDRRAGDVDTVICNPSLAEKELGFKVHRDLAQMCKDLWAWQSANPKGYPRD